MENRRARASKRLCIEGLEPRDLLAVTVTTLVDENDGTSSGTGVSLRDAIQLASSSDTIDFASNLGGGTINLQHGQMSTSKNLTIDATDVSGITINAGDASRIFNFTGSSTEITLKHLTLTDGSAMNGADGGALYSNIRELTIEDVTITSSSASTGGGLFALLDGSDELNIVRSNITGNTSSSRGGGAYARMVGSSTANVTDSTISGNFGFEKGGGLNFSAEEVGVDVTVNISRSTVSGNTVSGTTTANGGGVYMYVHDRGTLNIIDSTISGNNATSTVFSGTLGNRAEGAGVFLCLKNDGGVWADMNIVNSTISGNESSHSGGGIAIIEDNRDSYSQRSRVVAKITNTTITRNVAESTATTRGGGGIYLLDFDLPGITLNNTIVSDNLDESGNPDNIDGNSNLASSESNLVGSGGTMGGLTDGNNGNLVGTTYDDPQLGDLGDNGGPTESHLPLPGSPAIDAGDDSLALDVVNSAPTNPIPLVSDQRGYDRFLDGDVDTQDAVQVDIGAIEFRPGDADLDNDVDVVDIDLFFDNVGNAVDYLDLDQDGVIDIGDFFSGGTLGDIDILILEVLDTYYGDANLSGCVDAADINAVGQHWQQMVDSWADGDFNGDGVVDGDDLNLLGIYWQSGCPN